MLESLSTAIVELDEIGCIRQMNAAAENCLATGRERAHGGRFHDLPGIPSALNQAIAATASDHRSRHLRECRLADGLYDCNIQNLPNEHLLLEFYNLKWQPGQSLEKNKKIYSEIFNKRMKQMHQYNQSIDLNPD